MTPIDTDENKGPIGIDESFDFLIHPSLSLRIAFSSTAHLGVTGG